MNSWKSQHFIRALLSYRIRHSTCSLPDIPDAQNVCEPLLCLTQNPRFPENPSKAMGNQISFSFASTEQSKAARVFFNFESVVIIKFFAGFCGQFSVKGDEGFVFSPSITSAKSTLPENGWITSRSSELHPSEQNLKDLMFSSFTLALLVPRVWQSWARSSGGKTQCDSESLEEQPGSAPARPLISPSLTLGSAYWINAGKQLASKELSHTPAGWQQPHHKQPPVLIIKQITKGWSFAIKIKFHLHEEAATFKLFCTEEKHSLGFLQGP